MHVPMSLSSRLRPDYSSLADGEQGCLYIGIVAHCNVVASGTNTFADTFSNRCAEFFSYRHSYDTTNNIAANIAASQDNGVHISR